MATSNYTLKQVTKGWQVLNGTKPINDGVAYSKEEAEKMKEVLEALFG